MTGRVENDDDISSYQYPYDHENVIDLEPVAIQPLVRKRAFVADSAPGGSLNGSTAMGS